MNNGVLAAAIVTNRLLGPRIFGRWNSYESMLNDWSTYDYDTSTNTPRAGFPEPHEILFASYGGGSYEGDATVIFRKGDKLYEAHDSHCSCNGLENWEPEETTVAALAMRDNDRSNSYYFLHDHDEEAVEAYWRLVAQLQAAEKAIDFTVAMGVA